MQFCGVKALVDPCDHGVVVLPEEGRNADLIGYPRQITHTIVQFDNDLRYVFVRNQDNYRFSLSELPRGLRVDLHPRFTEAACVGCFLPRFQPELSARAAAIAA